MLYLRKTCGQVLKILLFWILFFDVQRILFSIRYWSKLSEISIGEWFLSFVYSFRLDLATAAILTGIPLIILLLSSYFPINRKGIILKSILVVEMIFCALIHSGEVNAYLEWNHKLTSQVFMHFSNPDEVFRTAEIGMILGFVFYSLIELLIGFLLIKKLFKGSLQFQFKTLFGRLSQPFLVFVFIGGLLFILIRGGLQQIPLNIDSAYYSNNHVANDISVNSLYYFGKSFLLYNRSEIDEYMPEIEEGKAEILFEKLYNYPRNHQTMIFENQRPNVVLVVLEGWSADAMGCLSETKGATPYFDQMASEGLLFTQLYACGITSEIGNASIFGGVPALPEISLSMQPDKHRNLPTLNENFKRMGYSSSYLFSGDLKYGNIGGFLLDHGFDEVEDENDFPSDLNRGKLNFYDADLFELLKRKMDKRKTPFFQCVFTGSTHAPYDHPKKANQNWKGLEPDYMNSLIYADESIGQFIEKCSKSDWFDNTIFLFVSDHGHASPLNTNPIKSEYFRVPFLIYGKPLKAEFKGKRMDNIGSQGDIAATLLYQLGEDNSPFVWSKDLLNPKVPQFAFHSVIRGYGWVSPNGNHVFHMDGNSIVYNNYTPEKEVADIENCNAFITRLYQAYKRL
jgi:phosphoglycerol transferase MdoB-like AlkP superfamily enzyme